MGRKLNGIMKKAENGTDGKQNELKMERVKNETNEKYQLTS